MKNLTDEQLQENYDKLIQLVTDTFDGDKRDNLLKMYDDFQDRSILFFLFLICRDLYSTIGFNIDRRRMG